MSRPDYSADARSSFATEDPELLAPDAATTITDREAATPETISEPIESTVEDKYFERMPPVPAEELEAVKHFNPDDVIRSITNV